MLIPFKLMAIEDKYTYGEIEGIQDIFGMFKKDAIFKEILDYFLVLDTDDFTFEKISGKDLLRYYKSDLWNKYEILFFNEKNEASSGVDEISVGINRFEKNGYIGRIHDIIYRTPFYDWSLFIFDNEIFLTDMQLATEFVIFKDKLYCILVFASSEMFKFEYNNNMLCFDSSKCIHYNIRMQGRTDISILAKFRNVCRDVKGFKRFIDIQYTSENKGIYTKYLLNYLDADVKRKILLGME